MILEPAAEHGAVGERQVSLIEAEDDPPVLVPLYHAYRNVAEENAQHHGSVLAHDH
ncbi:hypothetical protein WMF39_40960 [Sorangium sp. So ce1504]